MSMLTFEISYLVWINIYRRIYAGLEWSPHPNKKALRVHGSPKSLFTINETHILERLFFGQVIDHGGTYI